MKKQLLLTAAALGCVGLLSACGQSTGSASVSTESSTAGSTAESIAAESTKAPEESQEAEASGASTEAGTDASNDQRTDGGPRGGNGHGSGGMTANSPKIQAVIDENSGKFQQLIFTDPDNGFSLEYSLYVPENYDENEEYPLIMYIPDSTGAGKSAKEIVEQYYGADVWVTEEDQAVHASFVLVPAFSETVVDDNFTVSAQVDTAVKLLESLQEEYSIDSNRLYTTGQSMGCMTSLYLNSVYPDLFAASLYVSGQWDISVLQGMENQKFFYIVAGGDAKASAGQDEVIAMFDADSVSYSFGEWSAQEDENQQNVNALALIQEGNNANMIRFETGTVLTEGSTMEHMASFNYGYDISAVRDWLFEQSK